MGIFLGDMVAKCVLIILALLLPASATADYYHWITSSGTHFYSDKPKVALCPDGTDSLHVSPASEAEAWPSSRVNIAMRNAWSTPASTAIKSNQQRQARPDQTFANCAEARAAGRFNIRRGDPSYSSHLDGDNDGIACDR